MWRKLTTTQLVIDLLIAGVFFLVFFVAYFRGSAWDIVVLLGLSTALALRRLSPALALGIAWASAITQMIAHVDPNPADVAVFAIVYAAAAYGSSVTRWLGLASALVAPAAITGYILTTQGLDQLSMCLEFQYAACSVYVPDLAGRAVGWFVAFAFAFLLAWTIGQLVRTRIRAGASRAAAVAAEQEIAAEQERTRIARDMHDVVAHSLAVVVAQADGARYIAASDPVATQEALRTIATTAREALADVRVLLAQLRYQQEDGPQPALIDLDRLLDQLRASGLPIVREEAGTPLPMGAAQQLAVYRIVQESLTNALRHADVGKEVVVRFVWTPHGVELSVSSALPELKPRTGMIPLGTVGLGHGIAGMTERATLTGGWLRTTTEGGRFVVTAWLPASAVPSAADLIAPAPEYTP